MKKCKDIIELVSQRIEAPLSWRKTLELKFHLLICSTCNRYATQLAFLQKALSAMNKKTENIKLSDRSKQRIARNLETQISIKIKA